MNKLLTTVGLAIGIASASLLAGCNLYFGNSHDHANDSSSSPGDSSGSNASGSSAPGTTTGSQGSATPGGPGFECKDNTQCSAGCFCADGTCTEAGFCGSDKDCGEGFHCDTARSSCEPNPLPAKGCQVNTDCAQGSVCDATSGACTATCTCTTDADAVKQGAGFCDESRNTCMTGTDPNGSCGGTVAQTCTAAVPSCGEGQVATISNGCYSGQCEAITACSATPACSSLQHQDDCSARAADCTTVSEGHNCTKPDGSACSAGDTNCQCQSFTYQSCEAKGASGSATRIIFQ